MSRMRIFALALLSFPLATMAGDLTRCTVALSGKGGPGMTGPSFMFTESTQLGIGYPIRGLMVSYGKDPGAPCATISFTKGTTNIAEHRVCGPTEQKLELATTQLTAYMSCAPISATDALIESYNGVAYTAFSSAPKPRARGSVDQARP